MNGNNSKGKDANAHAQTNYEELLGPLFKDGGRIAISCCPNCGSTERVMQSMYDYLVSVGKAVPGSIACSSTNRQAFIGSSRIIGAKAVSVTIFRDICKVCNLEYPILIAREDGMLTAVPGGKG